MAFKRNTSVLKSLDLGLNRKILGNEFDPNKAPEGYYLVKDKESVYRLIYWHKKINKTYYSYWSKHADEAYVLFAEKYIIAKNMNPSKLFNNPIISIGMDWIKWLPNHTGPRRLKA